MSAVFQAAQASKARPWVHVALWLIGVPMGMVAGALIALSTGLINFSC